MAFDINQFRDRMYYDGARPNLFQVVLQFPSLVPSADTRQLAFMASGTQLPASTIGVARQFYFGREVKFPGNRTFQDWSINVINDESFTLRDSFEQWSNIINNNVANVRDSGAVFSGGYSTNATVTQFSKDGTPIKSYNFVGLFPVQVDPINLNWGSNDVIEEFGVTFSYQYWDSNSTIVSPNANFAANQ